MADQFGGGEGSSGAPVMGGGVDLAPTATGPEIGGGIAPSVTETGGSPVGMEMAANLNNALPPMDLPPGDGLPIIIADLADGNFNQPPFLPMSMALT